MSDTKTTDGDVICLDPGRVYALSNPYELNGQVSSHGPRARGFAPYNCYLLVEPDETLLVDSGFSAHQASLFRQLDSVITRSTPLAFIPQRISEFGSVCNVRSIAETFALKRMAGFLGHGASWFDFRPDLRPYGSPLGDGAFDDIELFMPKNGGQIAVGASGNRAVDVILPPFRLLAVNWLYDAATRTLFTGDAFCHVWRPSSGGPWIVGEDEPLPEISALYEFLTEGRYWWLLGAHTSEIETQLDEVFATYDVETIAPSFGCIIKGRELVEKHVGLLHQVLQLASAADPAPVPGSHERPKEHA